MRTRGFLRHAVLTLVAVSLCYPGRAAAGVQTLSPAADTSIYPGREAARDHGGAAQLRVQVGPRVSYLKFDLSSLPGPVAQATLVLSVTNTSATGGTVYRVLDTSWDAGLRFTDVDRNGDGRLDASDDSPLVPDSARTVAVVGAVRRGKTVRVDVSRAVTDGAGLYSLALASGASDLAAYASSEYPAPSRRPTLEVLTTDASPLTTTTTTTSTTLPSLPTAGTAGRAAVWCVAGGAFDRYTAQPSLDEQAWMRDHYWRMLTYAPYFDTRLGWFPSAWVYKDLYAVYTGSALATAHPEWILRDAAGQMLFIPYGCRGGTCPQYAADPGNAEFRAQWLAAARSVLQAGYRGLYVDDVNLFLSRVGNGAGAAVVPIDPRTGAPMTEADWRRYVAEFVEAIRVAFPTVEIAHNAIWYVGDGDPSVARQIAAADYQVLERGVNDTGLVNGSGRYGFDTFLGHLDFIHAAGGAFYFDGQGADVAAREYSLAVYLLGKAERDGITHDHGVTPDDWWSAGWEVDLGSALGERYRWNGVWRRDFAAGLVLVNPPGAPAQTLVPGGQYRDLTGVTRTAVVLGPAQGAVLRDAN